MKHLVTNHAVVRWVERAMGLSDDVDRVRGWVGDGADDAIIIRVLGERLPGFCPDKIREAVLDAGGRDALLLGASSLYRGGLLFCVKGGHIVSIIKGKHPSGRTIARDS